MDRARCKLLCKIQALEFFAIDLNLFLDTHPRSRRALADYNRTVADLQRLKEEYEERYGPLTNFGGSPNEGCRWLWIDEPWPWETCC